MNPIQDFITRSRAICDAATRGKWLVVRDNKNRVCIGNEYGFWIAEMVGELLGDPEGENNAEFIAHARQALPAALEALGAMDSVMWMAEKYAEAGGSNGPEMRDYQDALANIAAALGEAKP